MDPIYFCQEFYKDPYINCSGYFGTLVRSVKLSDQSDVYAFVSEVLKVGHNLQVEILDQLEIIL